MDKTNFILYKDSKQTINLLSDEQAGKLFKAIFNYVEDRTELVSDDVALMISFTQIKAQLERDLKKYKNIVKRNQDNGKKGGRPKNPNGKKNNPKNPLGKLGNPKEPKKADSDSDSVNGSDNVSDKKEYFKDSKLNELFYDYLAMRKVIKKPATKKAIDLAINKIKKLNYDEQISMLENSILNNYQGLFLPSNNKDSKPNRQDIKDIKDTYITHIPDEEANNGPFKVGKN